MFYKIYQTNNRRYVFMGHEYAKKNGFSLNDYNMVYEGEIEREKTINETLEKIYVQLNMYRPDDYNARSLSVSDIVEINGEKYYVDSLGFTRI